MTTISPTAAASRAKPADRLLRTALKIDAVACGLTGLGFIGTPRTHNDLFGLPAGLTLPTGVFLLLFAVAVWFTGSRRRIEPRAVIAVISANVAWVVASVAVIAAGWLELTSIGIGYVVLQALAVGILAELEFIGMRRLHRTAAAVQRGPEPR